MAETLVLSNFAVTADGVVSGINRAIDATDRGQRSQEKLSRSQRNLSGTTTSVIGKFVSLRTAALRLAGVLGLGGLVVGLVLALKRLVVELITSTEWFERSKNAVVDWWHALKDGEDALGRVIRRAKELDAIKTGPAIELGNLKELVEQREKLVSLLSETVQAVKEAQAAQGELGLDKLGIDLPEDLKLTSSFEALETQIIAVDRQIREMFRALERQGVSAATIIQATGAFVRDLPLTPEELEANRKYARIMDHAADAVERLASNAAALKEFQEFFGFDPNAIDVFDLTGVLNATEFEREITVIQQGTLQLNELFESGGISANRYQQILDGLARRLEAAGFSASAARSFLQGLGAAFDDVIAGVPTLEAFNIKLSEIASDALVLNQTLRDSPEAFALYRRGVDKLIGDLVELGLTAQEARRFLEELGTDTGSGFKDLVKNYIDNLDIAQAKFEVFQVAIQGVGTAVSAIFTDSAQSGKQAIAGLLKSISQILITYAVAFAAAAIGASTGFGGIVLGGSPAQFKAASVKFFAAGALAGVAARALGGGGEGAGGGFGGRGRRRDRIGPVGPGINRTAVVVNFYGPIVGSGDPNELARTLGKLLNTSQSDGGF